MLAIAAAKLGWAPVLALDNDPASVAGDDRERRASTASSVEVRRLDLRTDPPPVARTVAANLLGPLLLRVGAAARDSGTAPRARDRQRPARRTRPTASPRRSRRAGLTETRRRAGGEWAALLLAGSP